MPTPKIRILLVDNHPAIRHSWKMLLEHNPLFSIIGECPEDEKTYELAAQLMPDILLLDLNLSPTNGFALTEKIAKDLPDIKVIGISVTNHPRYANRMIELGAKGFITKTSNMDEIMRGIKEVYEGKIYVCDEIRRLTS